MLEFLKGVFHPQWITRAVISLLVTGATVWAISFKTADYVVAANTSSMGATLSGLQSSLDRLNDAVRDNTEAATRLQESIARLREDSASQSREISFLRDDVTKIADAVQDAGIPIRINSEPEPTKEKALDFLQVTPPQVVPQEDFDASGFVIKENSIVLEGFVCSRSDAGQTICVEKGN